MNGPHLWITHVDTVWDRARSWLAHASDTCPQLWMTLGKSHW